MLLTQTNGIRHCISIHALVRQDQISSIGCKAIVSRGRFEPRARCKPSDRVNPRGQFKPRSRFKPRGRFNLPWRAEPWGCLVHPSWVHRGKHPGR